MQAPAPLSRPYNEPAQPKQHDELQTCPGCGHEMPALKGARLSICRVCGYKESCCY